MTVKQNIFVFLFVLSFVFFQGNFCAYAQPKLPGAADTGRFENRILNDEIIPVPQIIPPNHKAISKEIPVVTEGFELKQVNLIGNTAYPTEYFNDLIGEYIGRIVNLETLNHLADNITETYREDGYFLSRIVIPEQEVVDGVITIQIVEGYVNNVILKDPENVISNDPFSIFEKTKNNIMGLRPLHGPTLEHNLLLLNEGHGVSVNSYIKSPEGISSAGAVDVVLVVSRLPQSFSLEYNNFGSRYVGPHQLEGTYVVGNAIMPLDQLYVQSTASMPMDEMGFGAFGYSFPLNEHGLRTQFKASYSKSDPGYILSPLEVEGTSQSYEVGITYPYIRSRRKNVEFGAEFAMQNTSTEFLDQELINDKTRSIELSINYEGLDRWNAINRVRASLTKGFGILGASKAGSDKLSRAQGRSDFVKAEIKVSRHQEILQNFQLSTSAIAQYAPHPLLSSEEFGYGGNEFGRAYDPSEILGDKGLAGSAELNYNGIDTVDSLDLKLVPFVFYDIGKVWNEDRGSKPVSAASAGVGTHYYLNDNIKGSLQFAWPLTKSIDAPVMNGENGPRVLFNIAVTF